MVKVEAVWFAKDEAQADEMLIMLVEKYKVGVSYSAKQDEENDDDSE